MAAMTAPPKRRRTGIPISTPRSSLPPFLAALWDMVESEDNNSIISWTRNGTAFAVHDPESFELVLPTYFKHNRFTSFIRQLNMYQFSKVTSESGNWEWHHDGFRHDAPELMHTIQRRAPSANALASPCQQTQAMAILGTSASNSESLAVQPVGASENSDSQAKSLEQRVSELEKNRVSLLSELRFEKIAQQKMQNQIETLEGQVQAVINYLFKSKSYSNTSAAHNFSLYQLLLEDKHLSPNSNNEAGGNADSPSGRSTPRFTEDALSDGHTARPEPPSQSGPDASSNGLSSVDALLLDLDLNLDDLPHLPDLPESPISPYGLI